MIEEIKNSFNPDQSSAINILVEAGPTLLKQMIDEGLIDNLYLTVNLEKTGENPLSIADLTKGFELVSRENITPCDFFHYKKTS